MILERLTYISTVILDVDGVLTEGKVQATADNNFLRTFDIKDGFALQFAVKQGIRIIIISGGHSSGVINRLKSLGITEINTAVADKRKLLNQLVEETSLNLSECVYMGDDYPDISVMNLCGVKACPADAVWEIKNQADWISTANGGNGAVRELLEIILRLQDRWESSTHSVW